MVATAAPSRLAPAGIATRGTALAVDAAIANLICLVLGALIGLVTSLVGDLRPQWLVALLAAAGWALIVGGYFTLFWSTTGQTPGMRLMRLRVVTYAGGRVHFVPRAHPARWPGAGDHPAVRGVRARPVRRPPPRRCTTGSRARS